MSKYIDFVINYKNGKKEIEVVNGDGVKCSDVPTDNIVKKLMGEGVELTDFAHTDQYFDESVQVDTQEENSNTPFINRRDSDEKGKSLVDI